MLHYVSYTMLHYVSYTMLHYVSYTLSYTAITVSALECFEWWGHPRRYKTKKPILKPENVRVSSKRVFLRRPRILTTPPYKNSPFEGPRPRRCPCLPS